MVTPGKSGSRPTTNLSHGRRLLCLVGERHKKAQGKTAKQALVVVAVKLLHAVYAMLKHRQPYNPSRLLVAPATIGS